MLYGRDFMLHWRVNTWGIIEELKESGKEEKEEEENFVDVMKYS